MIRRPPRSTRTDTLFPYTVLRRSPCGMPVVIRIAVSLVVTRRSSTYRLVRAAPYRQSRYAGLRTPVDGVPRYGGPAARAAFTGSRTFRPEVGRASVRERVWQ